MIRPAVALCFLSILIMRGVASADETEDKAIAMVLKLGGKTKGRPVVDVRLSESEVTDADLETLAALKLVKTLWLHDTRITDAGLQHLASLKQLQNLNLYGTNVTDAGLKELAGLTQLRKLELTRTKVTEAGLKELAKALPDCQIVSPFAATTLAPDAVPQPSKIADSGTEFYHDFRNKDYLDGNFDLWGPEAALRIRSEPEGLRITLPADQNVTAQVGLTTRFRIRGDFDIAVGYEIIRADQPKTGKGAGFEVYLWTNASPEEKMGFSRLVLPDGSNVYRSSRMTTNKDAKRVFLAGAYVPASGKSGKLRITRNGPNVSLSAAEQAGGEFRVLYHWPLGTEDIALLRFAAHPGDAANSVDLRLHDVRVRGVDAATLTDGIAQPARKTSLWAAAFLAAALLVIGGIWMWWHKGRKVAKTELSQPEDQSTEGQR